MSELQLLEVAVAQAQAAALLAAQLAGVDLAQLEEVELPAVPDPPPLEDLNLDDLWGCELLADDPPPLLDLPELPPLPDPGWWLD